jgi:hypothetical protein
MSLQWKRNAIQLQCRPPNQIYTNNTSPHIPCHIYQYQQILRACYVLYYIHYIIYPILLAYTVLARHLAARPDKGDSPYARHHHLNPKSLLLKILRGYRPKVGYVHSHQRSSSCQQHGGKGGKGGNGEKYDGEMPNAASQPTYSLPAPQPSNSPSPSSSLASSSSLSSLPSSSLSASPSPPSWPEGFGEALCQRCWAHHAADRYRTLLSILQ